MGRSQQEAAARQQVAYMTYEFKCSAEFQHHPEREGQPGWNDGFITKVTAPAPPAPAPVVVSYCGACQIAIDNGEAP